MVGFRNDHYHFIQTIGFRSYCFLLHFVKVSNFNVSKSVFYLPKNLSFDFDLVGDRSWDFDLLHFDDILLLLFSLSVVWSVDSSSPSETFDRRNEERNSPNRDVLPRLSTNRCEAERSLILGVRGLLDSTSDLVLKQNDAHNSQHNYLSALALHMGFFSDLTSVKQRCEIQRKTQFWSLVETR